MTRTPYDPATQTGDSTCLTRCVNGWTSNGDTETHKCTRCNPRCETCEDQGGKKDKDLCKECSTAYPFQYAFTPDVGERVSTCFKECGRYPEDPAPGTKPRGLYKITSKTCGDCAALCLDCEGDKFNCTKCDVDQKLALFQKKMLIGGTP